MNELSQVHEPELTFYIFINCQKKKIYYLNVTSRPITRELLPFTSHWFLLYHCTLPFSFHQLLHNARLGSVGEDELELSIFILLIVFIIHCPKL